MRRKILSKLIITLTIINLPFLVWADFGTATNIGTGVQDSSIVLGDIDNDGDLDLIVTGSGGMSRLDKYINNGSGNFTGPVSFGTGVRYSSIALGDIDSDGDLDLIVTGLDNSSVKRLDEYINDGSGNFTGPLSFGTGIQSSSIALGDIDNDGDLDLIVTGDDDGSAPHRLDKYINDGSGNFAGPVSFGTGVKSSSISLGDIDNDGDLDLIVTGFDGSTTHLDKYINDGSGNFTGPTAFGTSVGNSSIALGDIDNDGDLDLILTGWVSGTTRRSDKYINNGIGNFVGPTNFGIQVELSSIALGDIDNDGDLDFIVTGSAGGVKRLDKYINNGIGGFMPQTNSGTGVYYSSIALGDIDNDGDLDLIVSGYDGSSQRLYRYFNLEVINNTSPTIPTALTTINQGGYWQFKWNASSDDHTPVNMIRYKVAYGTNFGIYNLSSSCIDYPRGQANLGNVCVVTGEYYQSKVTNTKLVYWKVCAIDSAFKNSAYSILEAPSPNTPNILECNAFSANQINLAWNNVFYEEGYKIYINTINDTNTSSVIGTTGKDATNFNATGLSQNTKYYFWVKATNGVYNSGFSAVVSNITLLNPPLDSDITLTAISTNCILIQVTGPTNSNLGLTASSWTNCTNSMVSGWFTGNFFVYTNSGLLPNNRYGFKVKYRNGNGVETSFNPNVQLRYTLAKAPFSLVSTSTTSTKIILRWLGGISTSYILKRATNGAGPYITIGSNLLGIVYTNSGLSPNTTYYYRVYGINGDGIATIDYISNSFTTKTSLSPPNSPGTLDCIGILPGSINISWSDVSDETGYKIYRGNINNTNLAMFVGTTGINIVNWTNTGLTENTKYYYWVKSTNLYGSSGFSAVASNITLLNPPLDSDLSLIVFSIDTIIVSVKFPKNYNLGLTAAYFTNLTLGTSSGWRSDYIWTNYGLSPNTKYTFKVKYRNASGIETPYNKTAQTKNTLPVLTSIKEENIQIIGESREEYKGTFVPEPGKPLIIKLDGVINEKVNFKIFTITGEFIYNEDIMCDSNGNFKLQIPTNIAAGLYIIKVKGSNFEFTKKLPVLK